MWVLSSILYSLDTAAAYNHENSNCQWAMQQVLPHQQSIIIFIHFPGEL